MQIRLPCETATGDLGRRLAEAVPDPLDGPLFVALEGPLGAGKTCLARAFLRSLGHQGPVRSPTYTLVEPYDLPGRVIYHIDLYRVVEESELRYLGWTDLEDGLRLVEWPDRAPGLA